MSDKSELTVPPLRIFREWHWQPRYQPNPRMGGGPPPLELVARDQLQVLVGGEWTPVPIVEAEKPEKPVHPHELQRRQAMAEGLRRFLEKPATKI